MPDVEPPLKPLSSRTKWIVALCIGVIILLLEFFVCRLAYENGHWDGYQEGKKFTPPVVVMQSDEKALRRLSEFVEDASSSVESLTNLLNNREQRMAWIRDPHTRLETAWNLTRELINHDGVKNAFPIARDLIEQGYVEGDKRLWAQRAEFFADAVLKERRYADAMGYLTFVADVYEQLNLSHELSATLQKMSSVSLLMGQSDKAKQLLERAWAKSAPLGPEKTQLLKCRLLVVRGCLDRDAGKPEEARKNFEAAIAACPPDKIGTHLPAAQDVPLRIALAEALLESGKRHEALTLFKTCLSVAEKDAAHMLMDRLTILRGLARAEADSGNFQTALGYLNQAYGAAVGVVPSPHSFWPAFYAQRGWLHFMNKEMSGAGADFLLAARHPSATPLIKAQCYEGMGRIILNETGSINKEAAAKHSRHFNAAVNIRQSALPQDTLALGRVHYYHGQLWDMVGDTAAAQEAYANATDALSKWPSGAERDFYLMESGLCNAYALCELKRWQEAVSSFETVLPLMEGDRRSETLKQLGRCYDELGQTDKGDECWKEAGYPRVRLPARSGRRR